MEQEVFVHAYEVVRPIVLKASRQYFIQLWDQADMEQEAMMTLYQLLEKFPELKSDENYKTLMNELSMTENLIAEYRSNYNKQIKEYKRYVRKFPTRMFLDILGYEIQEYQYLDYNASVDAPQHLFGE